MESEVTVTKDKAIKKQFKETIKLAREISPMIRD
jgi:hypothetical protein